MSVTTCFGESFAPQSGDVSISCANRETNMDTMQTALIALCAGPTRITLTGQTLFPLPINIPGANLPFAETNKISLWVNGSKEWNTADNAAGIYTTDDASTITLNFDPDGQDYDVEIEYWAF